MKMSAKTITFEPIPTHHIFAQELKGVHLHLLMHEKKSGFKGMGLIYNIYFFYILILTSCAKLKIA